MGVRIGRFADWIVRAVVFTTRFVTLFLFTKYFIYEICSMFLDKIVSRNLFVPDFARRFFVSCAQIYVRYTKCILDVERTLTKFVCN